MYLDNCIEEATWKRRVGWLYSAEGVISDRSQGNKGIRWMPWRQEPMKDAASCDKLRGTASRY